MLNYKIYNNKKENWIVFIHGMGGSTLTWKKQIDFFSKDYNLLLIDLPGHGDSVKHKKISIKYVNDKIKEVLDFCNISKANFIGMSLGTLVVANFAVKYPNYVKTIIFGGAAINVDGIYKCLMNTTKVVKSFVPHRILYRVFAHVMMPKKNHKKSRSIFIRESLKMNRKDFLSWIDYLSEISHAKDLLKKLEALNIKTIFISGTEDICFIRGTKKAAKIIHAKFEEIKKCGHVCTIEKAEEFNILALKFLKTAPSAA